jgi:excisionase family DNA binding protein
MSVHVEVHAQAKEEADTEHRASKSHDRVRGKLYGTARSLVQAISGASSERRRWLGRGVKARVLKINDVESPRLCPGGIIGGPLLCQTEAEFRRTLWLNGRMKPKALSEADEAVPAGRFDDGYLSLRTLAAYAGLSVRTLRARLTNGSRPLPHYRVGGKILVRRTEFDAWMRTLRADEHNHVDEIVTTLLRSL